MDLEPIIEDEEEMLRLIIEKSKKEFEEFNPQQKINYENNTNKNNEIKSNQHINNKDNIDLFAFLNMQIKNNADNVNENNNNNIIFVNNVEKEKDENDSNRDKKI